MQSKATTVSGYLRELPPDRRRAIEAVRKVILDNLDKEYEEGMCYGMIGYSVPHRVYPPGYHCNPQLPLPFAGLASQKQYMSVYLVSNYAEGTPEEGWFRKAWAATGKKLDMGKCCIRFKKLEDLALDVIGEAVRRIPARTYIEFYEKSLAGASKTGARKLAAAKRRAGAGGGARTSRVTRTSAATKPGRKKAARGTPPRRQR